MISITGQWGYERYDETIGAIDTSLRGEWPPGSVQLLSGRLKDSRRGGFRCTVSHPS